MTKLDPEMLTKVCPGDITLSLWNRDVILTLQCDTRWQSLWRLTKFVKGSHSFAKRWQSYVKKMTNYLQHWWQSLWQWHSYVIVDIAMWQMTKFCENDIAMSKNYVKTTKTMSFWQNFVILTKIMWRNDKLCHFGPQTLSFFDLTMPEWQSWSLRCTIGLLVA